MKPFANEHAQVVDEAIVAKAVEGEQIERSVRMGDAEASRRLRPGVKNDNIANSHMTTSP